MKIGILTFHCAINYGAVLQAYGLQEVLKSLGHEVYIIDYRPEYLIEPYRLIFPEVFRGRGLMGNIRFFIRELLAVPIRYKRRRVFNRFIENRLHLASLDIQSENNDFDCFVFGSDQIWNPQITGGDSVFLGDAPYFKGKRMITYAASAGSVDALEQINVDSLKRWLSNFSALSVREKSLSDFLSEELLIENRLVIDPVLLAGEDVFSKVVSLKNIHKPYMLFFSLGKNEEALNFAKQQATLYDLELIEMYSMVEVIKNKKILQNLSPEDFVGYFQNAQYVVSTSFHGTVFSILFHKPFICLGDKNNAISRFEALLNLFGLEERLVDITGEKELQFSEINWASVNETLFLKRDEALSFIEMALK